MKNEKGITLVMLIVTVLLLAVVAGVGITEGINSYDRSKVVKFETYMKLIQKKVDLMIEEGVNYSEIGAELTQEQKDKLQEIITNDSSIETRNANESKLRYFSKNDIKEIFEIEDVNDEIVVNFANRDIISLNGIEKDEVMHYVEYTLH